MQYTRPDFDSLHIQKEADFLTVFSLPIMPEKIRYGHHLAFK